MVHIGLTIVLGGPHETPLDHLLGRLPCHLARHSAGGPDDHACRHRYLVLIANKRVMAELNQVALLLVIAFVMATLMLVCFAILKFLHGGE